jgi:hypothetical protein
LKTSSGLRVALADRGDEVRVCFLCAAYELVHKDGFARTGFTRDKDDLGMPLGRAVKKPHQFAQLSFTSHKDVRHLLDIPLNLCVSRGVLNADEAVGVSLTPGAAE